MKTVGVISLWVLISTSVLASQPRREFAAASIKIVKSLDIAFAFGGGCHGIQDKTSGGSGGALADAAGLSGVSIGPLPLGRCVWAKTSLQRMIGVAYGVEITKLDQQILGGPRWIDALQYSLEAVAPDPSKATAADLRLMLQSLLTDRFKLQIHQETRNLPGYVLLAGSGPGPKLQTASANAEGSGLSVRRMGDVKASNEDMPTLAHYLSDHLSRPVLDETGIVGHFNFTLTWTPNQDEVANVPPDVMAQWTIDPSGPSIFTALKEQLGLRLETRNVPTPVFVIDHVEMAMPN